MGKESYLESKMVEGVKAKAGLAIKLFSAIFTGLPDRMVLLPGGRIYFVEMKADEYATKNSEKRQRRQKFVRLQLQKLGFDVRVLDTLEKVKQFIDAI